VRRIGNVPATVPAGAEDRVAERLAGWAERHGVDTFVLWPDGDDVEGQIERFAGGRPGGARGARRRRPASRH